MSSASRPSDGPSCVPWPACPACGCSSGGSAAVAQETPRAARDVIQELGVRSFINAAGTFTALTGSLMRPEVVAAMQVASRKYVQHGRPARRRGQADRRAARLRGGAGDRGLCLGALAGHGGLRRRQATPRRIRRLPDTTGMKNEVLVQKTHRVGYDHAIRNAGVTDDRGRDPRGARERDQRADRDDVLPQLRRSQGEDPPRGVRRDRQEAQHPDA